MKIYQIVKKDLKILIRSRISALIILLGPLLIVSLIGLAYNNSDINNIKVGTYSESYSELSNNLVASLEKEGFSISQQKSEVSCIEGIKTATLHVCMILPKDLKVESNNASEIIFYVDNSRVNLVYFVISEISKNINLETKAISEELTGNILTVLVDAKDKLSTKGNSLTQIKETNSKINSGANNALENLESIDISLNTSQLGIDSLENGSLSCGSNCSSAYVDKVETLVNKLQAMQSDVNQINSVKDSIRSNLETIQSESEKSTTSINTLETDINNIVEGIDSLPVMNSESIVSPIKTSIKPVSESGNNLRFVFPTLIAMVVMLVSILLSSTIVIREKKTRAYFRNFITPTNNFTFILGTFITCLIILIVQLAIIFLQIYLMSRAQFVSLLNPIIALIIFMIATVFILIGMLIGYAFQSEETSTLAAFSIATIFLFLSNTILPIETIPSTIRWLALFNPFVITDAILKKVIIFGLSVNDVMTEVYVLISYSVLFLALVYITRIINKRRLV